ncbi:MAG: hypothetical protein FWC97_04305 [Treponema sp.]|nr:hypothetical protein [Treponema sp.]
MAKKYGIFEYDDSGGDCGEDCSWVGGLFGFLICVGIIALIIWGVVSGVNAIRGAWGGRGMSDEARAVWRARGSMQELRATTVRYTLNDDDINILIERDNQNINHALIICPTTSRNLTSEHIENFFNNDLNLATYTMPREGGGGSVTFRLTDIGRNFAEVMNRTIMRPEQIMQLVNNADMSERDDGITGRPARFTVLKSLDVCMEGFRIVMQGFNYNTLDCNLTRELFGEAFARQLVSDEFRELPLTNSENNMQSQYGRISYAIRNYGRRTVFEDAMFTPIERWAYENAENSAQINSVVRWLEGR